jgi:hypothetical protein
MQSLRAGWIINQLHFSGLPAVISGMPVAGFFPVQRVPPFSYRVMAGDTPVFPVE